MNNEELQESLNDAMRINARLMSELQQVKRAANDINAAREQLVAQVEQWRECADEAQQALGFLSHHLRGRMGEAALMDMAEKADALKDSLELTPTQCLAEVRAQAVEDAIKSVEFRSEGKNCKNYCYSDSLHEYAYQIRQQANK